MTRCIGGRLKASGLHGTDCRVAKTVAEIAGDAQNLNGSGRRDTKTNRHDTFDMKITSLFGVLWLGFEENLRSGLRCDCAWTGGLRQWWRSVLAEVDCTRRTAWSVQRTSATGDSELHADNGTGSIISSVHVLTAG